MLKHRPLAVRKNEIAQKVCNLVEGVRSANNACVHREEKKMVCLCFSLLREENKKISKDGACLFS